MRRLFYTTLSFVLLITVILSLVPAKIFAEVVNDGGAATVYSFQDASTITAQIPNNDTPQVYFDDTFNSDFTYKLQGGDSSCGKIHRDKGTLNKATLYTPSQTNPGHCTTQTIPLENTDLSQAVFVWNDSSTLSTSDNRRSYSQNSNDPNMFIETKDEVSDGQGCQDSLEVTSPSATTAVLTIRTDQAPHGAGVHIGTGGIGIHGSGTGFSTDDYPLGINDHLKSQGKGADDCYAYTANVTIAPYQDPNDPKSALHGANSGGTGGSGNQTHATCDSDGGALDWMLCAIFNGVAGVSDWLFEQVVQPELRTAPISTSPGDCHKNGDCSYQIWSTFRVYGDIFLVIALLVIVFGQSIGGGIVDAYTAKKVLPRLLVAAILINLSIYIVAALVDITNVIGGGLGQLMTAPLSSNGAFKITLSGVQAWGVFGVSGLTIAGVLGSGVAGALTGSHVVVYILLFLVMPVVLGLLAAFITMIIRKAAILALVLISPVAFALYCLPNTEKYFRKWWDFLLQMLSVYPIVIAFFAIADILSVTLMQANHVDGHNLSSAGSSILAAMMAFFLQFLPLVFIPYAFRLAGGAIGKLHETLTNYHRRGQEAIKGNPNNPYSLRNRTKHNMAMDMARGQARAVDAGRRLGAGRFARMRGAFADQFGDVDARLSRYNKDAREQSEMMSATGRDALRYAGAGYRLKAGEAASQFATSGGTRIGGSVSDHDRFFDAKGREINHNTYARGKQLYGSGADYIGQGLEYALRKAQTPEDIANFRQAYAQNAVENNWNDDEAGDVWASATFGHKDKWKSEWYSTPSMIRQRTGTGTRTTGVHFADVEESDSSYDKMIDEFHKVPPGFQISSIRSQDWQAMYNQHQAIQGRIANGSATQQDIDRFAKTSEVLDTMTARGLVMQNNEGEVTVQGANAETQAVISSLYKSRRYATAPLQTVAPTIGPGGATIVPGTYSPTERAIYDVAAVDNAHATGVIRDQAIAANTVATAHVTDDRANLPRTV